MDIEETKRIIQNKIQADEAAREVRSQIKTYIHEKQNLRVGFTETFKPLIETTEKVKEINDTQQNKLMKQLQENQLALTQGLEGNKLAITSGFDKMDEVKKWDLEQLPGHEAIEEAEKEDEEDEDESEEDESNIIKKLYESIKNKKDNMEKLTVLAKKANEEDDISLAQYYISKLKEEEDIFNKLQKNLDMKLKTFSKKSEEKEKTKERIIKFGDTDFDSGLNTAASVKFLEENDLPLPSRVQKESYQTIKRIQRNSEKLLDQYKYILVNKADFKTRKGISKAIPLNKNPRTETLQQVSYYNILGEYVNNMNKLENIARKKEGKGIIHFNNPQQLVKRLELLAGSIIAGNNGVKQEFSQIAHLLHQLKVITKKTLNDLLKKYILFK